MTNQQSLEINVSPRTPGKGKARSLRSTKMVPAIVYGPKISGASFSFSEIEADKYSKHKFDNVIFTLKSEDPKLNNLRVLRKDFDVHPLSRRPIHFDFYAIDMTAEVTVDVELRFEGKPAGAAEGGLLNIVRRDVEISCLPGNIPEFISVDVSELGLGESIHVSDLKLPPSVEMVTNSTDTLATCAVVKEEVATPEVSPTDAAAAGGATPGAATPSPEKKN